MRKEEEEEDPLLISSLVSQEEEPECESLTLRTWIESKKIWQIAGPSIFTRLAMFSVTVITQSFAGHLSDIDLAAISIVTTVIIAITFGFLVINFLFANIPLFLGFKIKHGGQFFSLIEFI